MSKLKFGIIGDGKVAKHFRYYLSLLNIPCEQWSRKQSEQEYNFLIKECSHIGLLISDKAIVSFIESHTELKDKVLFHFSGNLVTDLAFGVHPLMTFSNELYDLTTYQTIPFVCEENVSFENVLPGITNPYFNIKSELKPYYHSLCVMSGNFTTMLWSSVLDAAKDNLQFPKEIFFPYMLQTFKNLQRNHKTALTGPIERRDKQTIVNHLEALSHSDFQDLYYAFLNFNEKRKVKETPKVKSIFS